jgi:hypothetical protein
LPEKGMGKNMDGKNMFEWQEGIELFCGSRLRMA